MKKYLLAAAVLVSLASPAMAADDSHVTTGSWPMCVSESDFDRFYKLLAGDKDREAVFAFLNQKINAGECGMTKPGVGVRVEVGAGLFGGSTCIQVLGSPQPCVWTNREAID